MVIDDDDIESWSAPELARHSDGGGGIAHSPRYTRSRAYGPSVKCITLGMGSESVLGVGGIGGGETGGGVSSGGGGGVTSGEEGESGPGEEGDGAVREPRRRGSKTRR